MSRLLNNELQIESKVRLIQSKLRKRNKRFVCISFKSFSKVLLTQETLGRHRKLAFVHPTTYIKINESA